MKYPKPLPHGIVTRGPRGYIFRTCLTWYKLALQAHYEGTLPPQNDTLVPWSTAAHELGIDRRTWGRELKAAREAMGEAPPPDDPISQIKRLVHFKRELTTGTRARPAACAQDSARAAIDGR